MKNLFLTIIALVTGSIAFAQNCDSYFPMKEGARMQYETKDNKDRSVSTLEYFIKKIENTRDGQVATIQATVTEGKKKNKHTQDFRAICKGGVLSKDYESLMPSQVTENFKDLDFTMDGKNMEWPSNLKVGETLPDAQMVMTLSMGGMNMEMSVEITNRKIEKKETITTPAGSFDCFLVSHNTKTKTMGTTLDSSTKQWISKDLGMIKTEDYSKGKLESTVILTAYSK